MSAKGARYCIRSLGGRSADEEYQTTARSYAAAEPASQRSDAIACAFRRHLPSRSRFTAFPGWRLLSFRRWHFSFRPLSSSAAVSVHLRRPAAGYNILGVTRRNPVTGLLTGCVIGLIQDSLTPHPLGVYGIAKTVVGLARRRWA